MHQEGRAEPPCHEFPPNLQIFGAWWICGNNPRKHSHCLTGFLEHLPNGSERHRSQMIFQEKATWWNPWAFPQIFGKEESKKITPKKLPKQFWNFNFISNLQTWILAPLPWPYFRSSLKIEFLMPKEDLLQKLLKSKIQTLDAFSEIFWVSLPSNIIEVLKFSFPIISFENNFTSA